MSLNPSLCDFVSHLRNCIKQKRTFCYFRYSKFIEKICQILNQEGFFSRFEIFHKNEIVNNGPQYDSNSSLKSNVFDSNLNYKLVFIKFFYSKKGRSVVQDLKLFSKPNSRSYLKASDIKPFRNGFGLSVLSTSLGVMSDADAFKKGVGGEILLRIF